MTKPDASEPTGTPAPARKDPSGGASTSEGPDNPGAPFDTTVGDRNIVFARTVELFDVPRERERKRGEIALILVFALLGIIFATFALLAGDLAARIWFKTSALPVTEIKEVITVVLPPVIALVGSVVGFYFGGKTT